MVAGARLNYCLETAYEKLREGNYDEGNIYIDRYVGAVDTLYALGLITQEEMQILLEKTIY